MRVDIPDGADPIMHVWGAMVPGIGPAAATFSAPVPLAIRLDRLHLTLPAGFG